MDQDANERTDALIAALLAMLRLMAEGFAAAFGAPAAMVKVGFVHGETRQRILRWLHDMECVAKRLLLLRATHFAHGASGTALFQPPKGGSPRFTNF